ncbi:MAG: ribonuclease III [Acidobacteriota bacterium]|nr:ribonuclease III [Acidobacteriota bacterium]
MIEDLEQALDYRFTSRELLRRALTHSSSAHETRGENPPDNERLEFLGDSVLGWLVSEWLFHRYQDFNEGQLSLLKNHLVSANHLLAAAQRLDLGRHLQLGRGEETAGGRSKQRLLVNAFEAVLAAVYLDGGPGPARDVLMRYAIPAKEELATLAGAGPPHDFRAQLERISRERKLPRPEYFVLGESGPGHARTFTVEVRMGRDIAASAEGSSKKIAAHNAAREVCRQLAV